MKNMMVLIVCVMIAGCDYTVPLVKTPKIEINNASIGAWKNQDENATERLLVLPLDKKECLVCFSSNNTDFMYARACLAKVAGMVFVQLKWFGNGNGETPDDNRVYQYASYSVENDTLRFRLLNPDVIDKNVTSTRALAKAIRKHKDDPNLLQEEKTFERVKD